MEKYDKYLSNQNNENVGENIDNISLNKNYEEKKNFLHNNYFYNHNNIAKSNFYDGISKDEYALISNSLVGGAYSRSKKTEIGGYWEKLIRDGYQTMVIDEPGTDCHTDKYITVELTEDNIDLHIYNWIIESNGKLVELTSDNKDKYIGKKVKMRFSIFCKNKSSCICSKCAGNFMYRRGGRNIGLACIQLAAKLKLVSMKAFHDSVIKTTKIDPEKAFSYFG